MLHLFRDASSSNKSDARRRLEHFQLHPEEPGSHSSACLIVLKSPCLKMYFTRHCSTSRGCPMSLLGQTCTTRFSAWIFIHTDWPKKKWGNQHRRATDWHTPLKRTRRVLLQYCHKTQRPSPKWEWPTSLHHGHCKRSQFLVKVLRQNHGRYETNSICSCNLDHTTNPILVTWFFPFIGVSPMLLHMKVVETEQATAARSSGPRHWVDEAHTVQNLPLTLNIFMDASPMRMLCAQVLPIEGCWVKTGRCSRNAGAKTIPTTQRKLRNQKAKGPPPLPASESVRMTSEKWREVEIHYKKVKQTLTDGKQSLPTKSSYTTITKYQIGTAEKIRCSIWFWCNHASRPAA